MQKHPFDPEFSCNFCDRLAAFRAENTQKFPDGFNGAVPSFGDPNAKLLIVGLAPGMMGANCTGRPFTGDWAGDLLYAALESAGLSNGTYDKEKAGDDGLTLNGVMITNAVRCVPPQNKPIAAEINQCRRFLREPIAGLLKLKAILTLGRIAHDSTVRALGLRPKDVPFGHGNLTEITAAGRHLSIVSSYHCSRYNTNTGRLTEAMFNTAVILAKTSAEI